VVSEVLSSDVALSEVADGDYENRVAANLKQGAMRRIVAKPKE
jgi:hypothetical protein